jgi:hypothetical protein
VVSWARFDDTCYKAFPANQLSWEAARQACLTMQGTLAVIDSPDLNGFVTDLLQGGRAYVGLK